MTANLFSNLKFVYHILSTWIAYTKFKFFGYVRYYYHNIFDWVWNNDSIGLNRMIHFPAPMKELGSIIHFTVCVCVVLRMHGAYLSEYFIVFKPPNVTICVCVSFTFQPKAHHPHTRYNTIPFKTKCFWINNSLVAQEKMNRYGNYFTLHTHSALNPTRQRICTYYSIHERILHNVFARRLQTISQFYQHESFSLFACVLIVIRVALLLLLFYFWEEIFLQSLDYMIYFNIILCTTLWF